ncbi:hypothetical protein LTR62_006443 [Meristemomyces frigidus]|uniref:Prolyl 4-hydroxylase alpha subunit domain-containing protein n=1 Tax=Meristemomyces frigidus TaxID=1508187 RepID=A0AAN7YPX5_9PEZI|nr:hypothetical protein LTR62_006443 [Meristemomyces frigidus]
MALPQDFLAGPAETITVQRINFEETGLPRYAGLYAVVLDNVLTASECNILLEAAAASNAGIWERAMINIGGGRQQMMEDERCCGRIIYDSQKIASRVWQRIEHLPAIEEILRLQNVPRIFGNGPSKRDEAWTFSRPNERMRFLKYVGGEYFRPHCDGTYETSDRKERSYFTLHLYLSQSEQGAELEDGATTFHSMDMKKRVDVVPKVGRILVFQHRELLHSGDDVVRGTKYTMRTDLMYRLEGSK